MRIIMEDIPLVCPKSPINRTSVQQKLQAKNAAKTYRYGTPKLREILREKCRIRIKSARQDSFRCGRSVNMEGILHEELAELEANIELQEKIYQELVDEVNDWFVEEQEAEEAYLIDVGERNDVICPVCQCEPLVRDASSPQTYTCKCETSFVFKGDLEQLRSALHDKIEEHEKICSEILSFFTEPRFAIYAKENTLNAMCKNCTYFCTL